MRRELGVRLINHHHTRCVLDGAGDDRRIFGHARGVVRRAEKRDARLMFGEHTLHFAFAQGEVGVSLAVHHGCTSDSRNMRVQLIRRFERGHGASRAAVSQQHALQHFVAAVGYEHIVGAHLVHGGNRATKFACGAIGVSIPANRTYGCGKLANELSGRLDGRLVGIESHLHRHLRRVITRHRAQIVAFWVAIHTVRLLKQLSRSSHCALQQPNGGRQSALRFIDRHQQRVRVVVRVAHRCVAALGQGCETRTTSFDRIHQRREFGCGRCIVSVAGHVAQG